MFKTFIQQNSGFPLTVTLDLWPLSSLLVINEVLRIQQFRQMFLIAFQDLIGTRKIKTNISLQK